MCEGSHSEDHIEDDSEDRERERGSEIYREKRDDNNAYIFLN